MIVRNDIFTSEGRVKEMVLGTSSGSTKIRKMAGFFEYDPNVAIALTVVTTTASESVCLSSQTVSDYTSTLIIDWGDGSTPDHNYKSHTYADAGEYSVRVYRTDGVDISAVPNNAFRGCTHITAISFPDTITAIGTYVVEYCTSLKSVIIGKGVTSIGNHAFQNCFALEYLYYGAQNCGVLTSGDDTFHTAGKSSGGVRVVIGSDVVAIPNYLFGSDDTVADRIYLRSITFENGGNLTTIGQYSLCGTSSHVMESGLTIPSSVTSIGSCAFQYTKSAGDLVVSSSTEIGTYAFEYGSFANITINSPSIGNNAFRYNECPGKLTINSASISTYAFREMSNLTELSIGESLTSIGDYAFYKNTALTSIYWDAIQCADLSGGNGVFYNNGANGGGITLTIGKDCTIIPKHLFYPGGDTNYPPYITSIIYEANSSLTSINQNAFAFVTQLSGDLTFPDTVTSIGQSAFNSVGVSSVTIGDNVTTIGQSAFQNLSKATEIRVGKGVTSLGVAAFYNAPLVTTFVWNAISCDDFSSDNAIFYNLGNTAKNLSVTIGNDVVKIPAYFLYSSNSGNTTPNIKSFTLGTNVTIIGQYAFTSMSALTGELVIPASVVNLGTQAFASCENITTLTINCSSIESIGTAVFYSEIRLTTLNWNVSSCSSIQGKNTFYRVGNTSGGYVLNIGASVVSIPDYFLFVSDNVSKCTTVNFAASSNLTTIGQYAFNSQTNITSLGALPDTLTTINQYAFGGCSAITSDITIPSLVTYIGLQAFYNCQKVPHLTVNCSRIDTLGIYAFGGMYSLSQVNWNVGSCVACTSNSNIFYASAYSNSGFNLIIGNTVTEIPAYLFYTSNTSYPVKVTTVTFTATSQVGAIGASAFQNDTTLTTCELPDSITSIGANAFNTCTTLSSPINIGPLCASIGATAFYCCNSVSLVKYNSNIITEFASGTNVFLNLGGAVGAVTVYFGPTVRKTPNYLFGSSGNKPFIATMYINKEITALGDYTSQSTILTNVYYDGTQDQWDAIIKGTWQSGSSPTIHVGVSPWWPVAA